MFVNGNEKLVILFSQLVVMFAVIVVSLYFYLFDFQVDVLMVYLSVGFVEPYDTSHIAADHMDFFVCKKLLC